MYVCMSIYKVILYIYIYIYIYTYYIYIYIYIYIIIFKESFSNLSHHLRKKFRYFHKTLMRHFQIDRQIAR